MTVTGERAQIEATEDGEAPLDSMQQMRREIVRLTRDGEALRVRVADVEDRETAIEQALQSTAAHLREAAGFMETLLDSLRSEEPQQAGETSRKTV